MKDCKTCDEFACGSSHTDNISEYCGPNVANPKAELKSITQFQTGAVRDTGGKGRFDLLPMCALMRVAKHMEDALTHYPERNWEKGIPMHSMIDSAFRHLVKYIDGWTDEDHLCSAATNLLMALWTEEKMPEMQDIPTRNVEDTCDCYHDEFGGPRCYGTKEMESCSCDGDTKKCNFYPNKRNG